MPHTKTSATPTSGGWKRACLPAAGLLFLAACSTTPQEREAKYMQRGKGYAAAKQYKKAVIEFKVASQNMPKDAEPVYQLGMTYLNAGAGALAVDAFTRAVSLNPKHEGAQFQMALVKAGSNKPELVQDAKQVLSAFLDGHPGNTEALESLALAEAKLGNKTEAVKLVETATEKNPANIRPAATVVALYATNGDVDTARQIARDLAERLPKSPDAAVLRGQVALATRDIAGADAEISRALSLQRDFRPALELRLRREVMGGDAPGAELTTKELSKLPEERTWAAYARILFSEKKVDRGIAEYERVLKEHGDAAAVRDEYSAMLVSAGRTKEAEAVLTATLSKSPRDAIALLQRATLEIDRGNLDGAAKDLKKLQEMKAFSPGLTYQQSRIFGARGETVRQGDLLAEALKSNPRLLVARLDLSRVLIGSGKAKDALAVLEQAAPPEKRTVEYTFYRNMALMAAGDWNEARKNVDTALAAGRSPGFLYQDGLLRIRNRDLAGARQSLESGFQLAPSDPLILKVLGEVMQQQGESRAYVTMIEDAARKNPSAPLSLALGNQLFRLGDRTGARAAFQTARAAGDVSEADYDIALLDLDAGALDQAKQRLLKLIGTRDNARARLLLAEVETRNGSAEAVVTDYVKALQFEPENVQAMNNLADFLASRQNKYDDAVFWAQKALARAPASPSVEDTLGWIYFRQGKYDQALTYLEKSLKGRDRPLAHYHLAAALLKAGDNARGKQEYEIAVKQDPKSDARAAVGLLFETGAKN